MTTESNPNDPRVSEAYHDLATEKTPPELDQKVLSMAAGNVRSRYGLARAWIRPVAWAATIGLSLAFVLEMSQLRDVPAPRVDADAIEAIEELVIKDKAPTRAKDENRLQQEPARRSNAPAAKPVSSPPAAAEPGAAPEEALATDSMSADFEADDMNLLREAEEQARARSGSERADDAVAGIAAFAEKKEQVEHCDSEARMAAESWYACIVELRDSGFGDAAGQEFETLLIEFPNFEEPDESR